MKTSIAIFTNNLDDLEKASPIIQSQTYDDILVFCDFNMYNKHVKDYSIFSSFYMKFFPGIIFFTNQSDFLNYNGRILGKCSLLEIA